MNFENFKSQLVEALNSMVTEGYSIKIKPYKKNNSTTKTGIELHNGSNVVPVLYAEDMYEIYKNGESIESIAASILMHKNDSYDKMNLVEDIFDYQKTKDKLCLKLINKKLNHELLPFTPHIDFLDLAIVLIVYYKEKDIEGISTLTVTTDLLEHWNVTPDEVFSAAAANCLLYMPPKFSSLSELIKPKIDKLNCQEEFDLKNIYVLTNRDKQLGSICMTYPGLLEKIAKQIEGSYFIIPSSIHELIIIKGDYENDKDHIDYMVRTVNKEELTPDLVLSNHAYYYDSENDKIIY